MFRRAIQYWSHVGVFRLCRAAPPSINADGHKVLIATNTPKFSRHRENLGVFVAIQTIFRALILSTHRHMGWLDGGIALRAGQIHCSLEHALALAPFLGWLPERLSTYAHRIHLHGKPVDAFRFKTR
jgi:hypothetical protein